MSRMSRVQVPPGVPHCFFFVRVLFLFSLGVSLSFNFFSSPFRFCAVSPGPQRAQKIEKIQNVRKLVAESPNLAAKKEKRDAQATKIPKIEAKKLTPK